jgi:Type IV leader peptidase family
MTTTLLVLLTLVLFPALMAFSASSDLFSMKISNRVSIALATAYPILAFGLGVPLPTIATNLACGFVVLLLTFTMFSRGWIGGGDVSPRRCVDFGNYPVAAHAASELGGAARLGRATPPSRQRRPLRHCAGGGRSCSLSEHPDLACGDRPLIVNDF